MFRNKTQRNRWLGVLSLVVGLHVLLGYLWFRHAPEVDAAASAGVSADMSVGVRTSSATQAESAEQSGGSGAMASADERVHPDGLRTENAEHIAQNTTENTNQNATQNSSNQSNSNSTGSSINSTAAQTSTRSDANTNEHSSVQSIGNGAEKNQTTKVDCTATRKSADARAGLDARVRVQRTADGRAAFLALVNQQGEASHYLPEITQAVQGIRFVSQDAQCVGITTVLTVRVVQ